MFHVGDESPLMQSSTSCRTLTKLFSGSGLVLKINPETRHRGLTEVSVAEHILLFKSVNYLKKKLSYCHWSACDSLYRFW